MGIVLTQRELDAKLELARAEGRVECLTKLRHITARYLREALATEREQIARELVAEIVGDPGIAARAVDANRSNVK